MMKHVSLEAVYIHNQILLIKKSVLENTDYIVILKN